MQYSYAQTSRRRLVPMDLSQVFQFVAPRVREAASQAAAQLERLGVRYALAGGLAVGAYGYLRATTDVDFLVGEEAFDRHGALVTFKPGIPIEVDGIRIDYLSPGGLGSHLEEALVLPEKSMGIPVVPLAALIAMKLAAGRRRDLLDVVELLKSGVELKPVRSYLSAHAPELTASFEQLAEEAEGK
ncbi:MAG: hypothetical protein AB1758_13190 [Candidatus Eremiobacterota bacterium]